MFIKNITIENFQSYYGRQTIEFEKGLNLVIGKGGKGKSKLFNAFYWVLFGKIYITDVGWCDTDGLPQTSHGAMQRHEFINMKALCDAAEGSIVTCGVRLTLEDDKGEEYVIERSVSAVRKTGGDWKESYSWDIKPCIVKVSYDSSTGTIVKVAYVAESIIDRLFPKEIRNYIWFQGESLESLINFRDKKTLEAAVQHISYYPFYQKLSEIISKSKEKIGRLEDRAIREANKNNSEAEAVIAKKQRLAETIRIEKEKREKILDQIDAIEVALADEQTKLEGLASYTDLVKQYTECENAIATLNKEIFAEDDYQRAQLQNLWILNGCEPLLHKSKKIIRNYTIEQFTAPERKYIDNPSRAKLEEIIESKQCFVCGAHVEKGNEQYEWIMKRIQEQDAFFKEMEEYIHNRDEASKFSMMVGRIQDYPDEIINALTMICDQYQKSADVLESKMALRKSKTDEKKGYDDKIAEIRRRFKIDPVKQASNASLLSSNISISRGRRDELKKQLNTINEGIKNFEIDFAKASDEAEKYGNGIGGVPKIEETQWKHISEFLEDICKRVQENAREELLTKIEKRANEFYARFTEHDSGYKGDVKIEKDYSIEFDPGLNTSHEDRKKMSIINALLSLNQEAMGIYYPFISDAPTSNFDPETTHKYLLGIKDIFGQTIIMTKDVEIDGQAYIDLLSQHNVSRIYELQSQLYCEGKTNNPELNEVSTIVSIKK